jgi:formylglycine-generating enzyme required for sulfatase activity
VTDNGANFTGPGEFKFAIVNGTNSSSAATATANPPSGGFITIINLTFGGSGYTTAPIVTIFGGGGSGAMAVATVSGGAVTGIKVSNPGSGYTNTPTVTIAAPPANMIYTTYWSNDGTSVAGSQPTAAVSVGVSGGLFTVLLGDTALTNMTTINPSLFSEPNLQLQIWFNDGVNGFAEMSPPLTLTPVPYAIQAVSANSASNLLGTLPAQQLSGTLPLAQLPGAVLTNNQNSVVLNGAFSGDGSGLTNLSPIQFNFNASLLTSLGNTNGGGGNFFVGSSGNPATSGSYNSGYGFAALSSLMIGVNNSANGAGALLNNSTGSYNTAIGAWALWNNQSGSNNTAGGADALHDNTRGSGNTANGSQALKANSTGSNNTAHGYAALLSNTNGNYNIALGFGAGQNLTTGSYNIYIGNPGVAGDNNSIRIGAPGVHTNAFIAGVLNGDGGGLTNLHVATFAPPLGMALIPAGAFTMGDDLDAELDANLVSVTVSAFYMDVNLISYSQWKSVCYWATSHGYGFVNAGAGSAANHPVQTVDWYDCVKWCNARSQLTGLTPVYYTDAGLTQIYTNGELAPYVNWSAQGYRLPTEAEWEKAARGGLSGQRFPWGDIIDENLANYYGTNDSYSYDLGPSGYNAAFTNGVMPHTSTMSYFAPNLYGLYDMAGNVSAWCWDWYATPYGGGTDPRGPASGSNRVYRGGSWNVDASNCRTAFRGQGSPGNSSGSIGFRSVLPFPGQ